MSRTLVLASTSRYRRALMDRLRLPYVAVAPPFEEVGEGAPRELIERFAIGKARSVVPMYPDALIVGSDQGMVAHGQLLGKPGTAEKACAQLASLAGGCHALITAVAVHDAATDRTELVTEVHQLRFRELSAAEIEAYVRLDEPLDCAGSFKIESLGVTLFDSIEGADPTGIMGLPLIRLAALLRQFGVSPLAA